MTEHEPLRLLGSALEKTGYGEYCSSFNPLTPRRERWIASRGDADETLRPLVDLFLLGRRVHVDVIEPRIAELFPALEPLGLPLLDKDGFASLGNLVLYRIFGIWLLFEQPSADPKLYFGDDSVALLSRLSPPRGGSTLDVCAGPGIQALHCARSAARVVALEINPVAASLIGVNARLNGFRHIEVVCGDLRGLGADALTCGEPFDHLTANPPLLPFPDHLPYPFVGHGGSDGLRLTWSILRALPRVLKLDGVAQIIGTA